jgi:hypothetical protein
MFENGLTFCSLITLLKPALPLRSWLQQGFSNEHDLDSSVKGGWESPLHEGGYVSVAIFVPYYPTVVWLCFKRYIVYILNKHVEAFR